MYIDIYNNCHNDNTITLWYLRLFAHLLAFLIDINPVRPIDKNIPKHIWIQRDTKGVCTRLIFRISSFLSLISQNSFFFFWKSCLTELTLNSIICFYRFIIMLVCIARGQYRYFKCFFMKFERAVFWTLYKSPIMNRKIRRLSVVIL